MVDRFLEFVIFDLTAKSPKPVTPVKTGVQSNLIILDSVSSTE
jgi:hypothetical protein